MTEEITMYDDEQSATYEKNIEGWVSRGGRFYGNNKDSEHLARWDGCTHRKCNSCEEPTAKHWLICEKCRNKKDKEKYYGMPIGEWDEETPLYSNFLDTYFYSLDEIEEYLYDLDDKETVFETLRLVICEPDYAPQLDIDHFSDILPEYDDVPSELEDAIDAFNEIIKDCVISWHPGKTRLDFEKYEQKRT